MNTQFQQWFREFPAKFASLQPSLPDNLDEGVRYRYMELDHSRLAEQNRTIEATLSSETPVIRSGGYREILSHDDGAVDLSRAVDGSLPLLWSHKQDEQIGLAEKVRVYRGRLRARLRFSTSKRGDEIWQDVKAGIVRGISVGYHIDEYIEKNPDEFGTDVVATRWTPFEASCVACPADLSAGIDRAMDEGSLTVPAPKVEILRLQDKLHKRYARMLQDSPDVEKATDVQAELDTLQRRILSVKTEAEAEDCFRRLTNFHIDYMAREDEETNTFGIRTNESLRSNPMEQFSLCRALAITFDPSAARRGGPELEVMEQLARQYRKGGGDRHTLPEAALFRAVTKGGSGANLIGTGHMAGDFIPALRERLITGRMGATILPGLTSDIQIPRQTADSSAAWLAGDGSDQVTPSDPTYDKITMKPTSVGVSSTISRKMLLQGDPASEQLVRQSLAFAVAKAIDAAAVNGSGSSNQPLGILGQTGVASTTYANGGSPSFGNIVDLEKELMTDDADMGNLGYVTTGAIAATLKQTEVVSTTGQMIWTATDLGEGRLNGYRALTSNLIPAGYVLFGNWSDLLIGMWSGLDFVVDPYTRASYGDVVITVFVDCDVAVRHGESFAEIHEAAP